MRGILRKIFRNRPFALTLRGRVLLYFFILSTILLTCLIPLLISFGLCPMPQREIGRALDSYIISYERSVSDQMSSAAARAILLGQKLSEMIERTLRVDGIPFSRVSDNPVEIGTLENKSVFWLRNVLLQSDCSASFVILDATVNSALPGSGDSRAGVYLKIGHITVTEPVDPQLFLVRGQPGLSQRHKIELHNNWNLEFNVRKLPFYRELLKAAADNPDAARGYFLSGLIPLPGTWERIMLLSVPLRGSDGTVYGICGLEINSLLYRLTHRLPQHEAKGLLGVLALKNETSGGALLRVGSGFTSGTNAGQFKTPVDFAVSTGTNFNRYTGGDLDYVGLDRPLHLAPISLPGQSGTWVVAALTPRDRAISFCLKRYAIIGCFFLLFLGISFVVSLVLAHRYTSPLLLGIQRVREGGATDSTNVREIDDLFAYMKEKEQKLLAQQKERELVIGKKEKAGHQADITPYLTFIEQIKTLSRAERQVFDMYAAGLNSHEIAGRLNLSINTIRTHNRNIYSKLYVSSYKEMMVYIRMMTNKDGQEPRKNRV